MATIAASLGPTMAGVAVKSQNLCRFSTIKSSEIGSVASQLSGIKISSVQFQKRAGLPLSTHLRPSLQPVARRVCPFTGKKSNKANAVSHSNHKTTRRQFVNLQYKRIWWEAGKRYVKLRLSTKAMKTIEKNGLDAVAKKAGIDLNKK
ncbi:50S ribosomal protein L28, chloroplastic [Andrographis paniculata]|uniref:50S ribosomal protein L28, chloroplastic n=1 Tax=Andrographis paniculata TaxID=175694 RepID=UPI0021E77E94|nr:50S ribosomal protein L28, chloroplastic [Andrographis paniculata]